MKNQQWLVFGLPCKSGIENYTSAAPSQFTIASCEIRYHCYI